jgi:hypothetical protein
VVMSACRITTSVTGSPPVTPPLDSDRIGDSGARDGYDRRTLDRQ